MVRILACFRFWGRITLPIISVVMGAGNYRRDAPPKSFIDVNDFPTIPDLANYLKFIADDEVLNVLPMDR